MFDETTLPAGLRCEHRTKVGVWGVIRVLEGRLRFEVLDPASEAILDPDHPGLVLPAGLVPLWPRLRTIIVDAGYQSGALTQHLVEHAGWELRIITRPRPGFAIVGPNWIVEQSFAWLGRHRRFLKDDEFRVQSFEALITIAACAPMLKRITPN